MASQNTELNHPHMQEIADQHFGNFDEQPRQAIIERMSRLVAISPEVGVDIHTGDELPKTPAAETTDHSDEVLTYSSPRIKTYLEGIATSLAEAHGGQLDEDKVWQTAMENVWHKMVNPSSPDERKQSSEEMVIMSRLSGVELSYYQVIETLAANRACAGLAVANPNGEGYIPVTIPEPELANRLIDTGNIIAVANYLYRFQGLDQTVANQLIDAGHGDSVANYLSRFQGLDQTVANQLIDAGDSRAVAGYLENFQGLDQAVANKLIEAGNGDSVARFLENFQGLDHSELANKLIEVGVGRSVVEYLENFQGLNHSEVANKLIEAGNGDSVARFLENFQGLDHSELANQLIEVGVGRSVVEYLENFQGLNHTEVANRLIEAGDGWAVADCLEKFQGLDHTEVANRLIKIGFGESVARCLEKFQGLDHTEVANRLVDCSYGRTVARFLEKFQGLDQALANQLILFNPTKVCQNLGSFQDVGATLKQLESFAADSDDVADALVENLACVQPQLSADAIYSALMACASHYSTAQKIKQLDLPGLGLSQDNVQALESHVAQLKPELHDVKYVNPYAETAGDIELVTVTKPGSAKHRLASEISRALRNPETASDTPGLENLKTIMEAAYQKLSDSLEHQLGNAEAIKILGGQSDNLTNSLMPVYRRLIADNLALESQATELKDIDFTALQASLESALETANKKFLQVLKVDVPYYDKLFTEWDAKRVGQREFQEVFLGRDGVYAYVGRRAQMQARHRAMGLGKEGNWQTIIPTYLVYPRGFRDNLQDDTKQAYLRENIKNPQAAHYYDTGFTGTIAEDIMRVLGLSREQWESRIRLLSASKRDRTVLGLEGTKSERDKIVNDVEGNPKDQQTAAGLYRQQHPDGSETLEPFAAPTSPAERLAFGLIQQALHRHYYVGELEKIRGGEQHFAAERIGFEHAEIRVSRDLSPDQNENLRNIFDHSNIGQHLLEAAKTIKVGEPDGPYPDEAVFELKLGDQDVIVKTVVLGKQQGPIDEYEALRVLESLGIDAPKPLARVFTQGQHGFIVMDKLPGISGRAVKDYFSQENLSGAKQKTLLGQAEAMMGNIAETIRRATGLDKPWRLNDFMLVLGQDSNGERVLERMLPIDFDRAKVFDPDKPQSIKLGQDLDVELANS